MIYRSILSLAVLLVGSSVTAEDSSASKKRSLRTPFTQVTAVGVIVHSSKSAVIDSVSSGTAAQQAGVLAGDVILNINNQPLEKPYQDIVATIIDAAHKSKKETVKFVFQLKRHSVEKAITFNVTLRELETSVAITKALDYLADELIEDPEYKKTPTRQFYAPIIYAPLAGLAFVESGSTQTSGRHATALRHVLTYVMEHGGRRKKNMDAINKAVQANICSLTHNSGYSAMFLAQLIDSESSIKKQAAQKPKFSRKQVIEKLRECCQSLEKLQLKNGGWQHGSGGKNGLGYTHLMAATVTAMNGLAMAQQVGVKVDQKVINKGLEYIQKCTDKGHVGYTIGNRGSFSAGRNAGVLQILYRLGLQDDKLVKPIKSKLSNNLRGAQTGHGSPVWHLCYAGMAIGQLSPAARDEFNSLYRKKLLSGQQKDGSILAPAKQGEQIGRSEENKVWGALYTTPLIVLALQAQQRQHMLIYNFQKKINGQSP